MSQKSIKDIIIVLKMILKFAVKQKLLTYNEIEIKFPTVEEKIDLEVLNKNDHRKIINYLQENFIFKHLCDGIKILR